MGAITLGYEEMMQPPAEDRAAPAEAAADAAKGSHSTAPAPSGAGGARMARLTRSRRPGGLRDRIRRDGPLTLIARWLGRLLLGFAALSLAAALLFRFVDPPGTYLIWSEHWRLGAVEQEWRALDDFAPSLRRAVVAAEDARFCDHRGFDRDALRAAIRRWRAGGSLIGGSTISQQTAKNLFLWPDRSLLRKGFEFWFTALIEVLWPKERILEVYLNIAEFGEGAFGAEAGARRAFGSSAAELSLARAAQLASVLPAPRVFSPSDPARGARVQDIIDGARTLAAERRDRCLGLGAP
ncbi:MAG: monofunctional biosynthetic peptidoglycan transglycosylase [Pseudomonadota bacterium]